jgi:hypothetical protein
MQFAICSATRVVLVLYALPVLISSRSSPDGRDVGITRWTNVPTAKVNKPITVICAQRIDHC